MKLDSRIIDRQYIFDVFNADKAIEFIGEDCYMTNDIELFKDLDRINVYTLDEIEYGFYNEEDDEYFDFCLPVKYVELNNDEEEFERMIPLSKEEYEKQRIEQIKDSNEFLNTLKDYSKRIIGYSQECMGTFTVKDGKVTDIHLTGIDLIPRFKEGEKND